MNKGFKPKQKTEYVARPAVLYRNVKEGRDPIFNLIINANELPPPNEKGQITLVGFVNNYKKSPAHPDVNFSVPKERPASSKPVVKQKDSESSDSDAGGYDWF